MIFDSLKNSALYYSLNPRLEKAFGFIASTDWRSLSGSTGCSLYQSSAGQNSTGNSERVYTWMQILPSGYDIPSYQRTRYRIFKKAGKKNVGKYRA